MRNLQQWIWFYSMVYGNDLEKFNLKIQLDLRATPFKHSGNSSPTTHDIKDYLVSLSPAARILMSEVCTACVKLVLVMPATNAVSERSASALRRIKSYLRATMQQGRLNSLMILHVRCPLNCAWTNLLQDGRTDYSINFNMKWKIVRESCNYIASSN